MDFGGFLICYTRGSTKPSTSEKNSVAICWGSNLRLTGLYMGGWGGGVDMISAPIVMAELYVQ